MSSGVPVMGERSLGSESYSRMVLEEDILTASTLEHHEDVTVDEARRMALASEVKNFLQVNPSLLQNMFDAVHFRQCSAHYIDSTFLGRKCYDDKLQGLQRDISSLHTKLNELAGLTNVLPDSEELITAMPNRDSCATKLLLLDRATTNLLRLVQEQEFREALKIWDELAIACGKLGEDKKKSIKERADALEQITKRGLEAIDGQLKSRAELDPAVQNTIKRVQRDTLTILTQLHNTIKRQGSEESGPTIDAVLNRVEKGLAACAAKVSKAFITPGIRAQPLVALTDQEINDYGAHAKPTGALIFNEGAYARWYKSYYIEAIKSGNRLGERAKAIDTLQLKVLASIDAASRGKDVLHSDLGMYYRVLHTINLNIDAERESLKTEETNHVVKYVLDYAMGLQSVLENVRNNLQLLTDLRQASSEAMQKVQKAVFSFLQPTPEVAQNTTPVELLFVAATLRDEAKETFDAQASDFVQQLMRAKIASLHEVLAAKKEEALELTAGEKAVSFRLSGYVAISSADGKLEDDVRTAIEKRIVKFLYWPENPRADQEVQERRRQEKFEIQFGLEQDLFLLNTKYKSLLNQAQVDHPHFMEMIRAFSAKIKDTQMEQTLLQQIADIEHLVYRASFPARLRHVAYARAWNHLTQLVLKDKPDVKRVLVSHLQACAREHGYIPVSKEYVDKSLGVLANNIKLHVDSVSLKLEEKQSILFRALACAIDGGTSAKESAAAQKIILTFIETDTISDYIKDRDAAFYTLIFENTKIKILTHREGEIGKKEMALFAEGPVKKYLEAFVCYHTDTKLKSVIQDINAKNIKNVKQPELDALAEAVGQFEPVFTDPLMERVLFRLAFVYPESRKEIIELRFMGNEDEYNEWYNLILMDMQTA